MSPKLANFLFFLLGCCFVSGIWYTAYYPRSTVAEMKREHLACIIYEVGWNPKLPHLFMYARSDDGFALSFREREHYEKASETFAELMRHGWKYIAKIQKE